MTTFRTLSLALLATAALARPAAAEIPALVQWQVEPTRAEATKGAPGDVQFQLSYRTPGSYSSDSHTLPLAQLAGLTPGDLAAQETHLVRFRLHRDAGDFVCEGQARLSQGSGSCSFAAAPGFAAALKARGVAAPDAEQTFRLAIADIGVAYVDELAHQGYAKPSPDDLVRAGQHGAGLTYLKTMAGLGYRLGEVADLVRARDHGINAAYVQSLVQAGYARTPMEDVLRARDHGVSASYLQSLAEAGYKGLPLDQVVRMRDHGVTSAFIRRINTEGHLDPDQLIRLRDRGER